MSQEFNFKLKVDEMKENDPAAKDENYHSGSNVRNVCFVQANGNMLFLNYSYLVSCEYQPSENSITLNFTSHKIIVEGVKLEILYQKLFNHVPRILNCIDERYSELAEQANQKISQITITEKNM
ncbi:hypothetical protein [Ferruginibacter sp. HRS2-29]|uniref:hypothetical protein n=1 Tax=Ferruginibacter sp. HRS2-29 TaxID=2487334 RepID=UPI0020CE02D6|nr:hypothetical protein [Ferruginibacter sp. HRS2-29]MCP9749993.1 hypothetical protein [Ferruginibacter sp. HRS2-29]